jgi:hypothetical protein
MLDPAPYQRKTTITTHKSDERGLNVRFEKFVGVQYRVLWFGIEGCRMYFFQRNIRAYSPKYVCRPKIQMGTAGIFLTFSHSILQKYMV